MRLINFSEEQNGGEGEKQSMGPSKRGRSSLDYKVQNQETKPLTTAKPGKRKTRRQIIEEQQARDAASGQMDNRIPNKSRARGGSGPPPRKWDLADLGNLNEEELLQALYSDPELAQEVAEMAEKMSAEEKSPPTGAPAGAKKSRRPPLGSTKERKEFSEYPDHMRELMDDGIPIMQWVILLLLLGVALYQLRKILMLPDAKEQQKGKGARAKAGGKKARKMASGGQADLSAVEETLRAIEIDQLQTTPPNKGASKPSKKAVPPSKKKKKSSKANSGPSSKKQQTGSYETVDSEDKDASKVDLSTPVTAPLQTALTNAAEDDGGGWHTVSKDAKPTDEKPSSEVPKDKASSNDSSTETKPPKVSEHPTPNGKDPTEVEASIAVGSKKEDTPPALNGSSTNKKKKQSKGDDTGRSEDASALDKPAADAPQAPVETKPTDNDEALAKKLQREEENLAQVTTNGSAENDVWEEVTTRKRKGNKPDTAAA